MLSNTKLNVHSRMCTSPLPPLLFPIHFFNMYLSFSEVINSVNEIMTQLNVIKATVASPNIRNFVAAVGSISDAVEQFCASVYFALSLIGDSNEVLKEEIMETMQQCIQCCIHTQLVASSKAMMHLMINPEITILTALRLIPFFFLKNSYSALFSYQCATFSCFIVINTR